ncbi:unnamed protein product [Ophioblennius macclurei]
MDGKSRLQQVQEGAEEVRVIMLDNMNKVDERGEKLENLEDRAEELLAQGKMFEKKCNQVKKKKMWEDKKMKIIFIGVGVVVVIIMLAIVIYACVPQQ